MSPLDDELRTALASRTAGVGPGADLFAGVERRARRMRRQRVAGAVASSALAVSALGIGGPMLASSLTSTVPAPSDLATTQPTPLPAADFSLDPGAPWPYRGVPVSDLGVGTVDTVRAEVATVSSTPVEEVDLTPLYGQVDEPSGEVELVFVVRTPGAAGWGVARSSESGAELVEYDRLEPGTTALAVALPGEAVSRLLVVAAPEVAAIEYAPDGSAWSATSEPAPGVGLVALDGDATSDRYRVLSPAREVLADEPAPDGEAVADEPEGPGTGTPPFVDLAPYRLDLDEPWAYRGPAELSLHPDLGSQDEQLFAAGGPGRDDGSWSQRPLLALEDQPSGTSVLVVLHRRGDLAVVTTTWQTGDGAARQAEQEVRDGQLLVQSVLPDVGPAGVLLALASPEAAAVETDVVPGGPAGATPGVLLVELPAEPRPGSVLLYTAGDGVLYHSEPARSS